MTRLAVLLGRVAAFICAIAAIALGVPQPAAARDAIKKSVTPYIEVGQVFSENLTNGVSLTYTQVAAGIDASVQTRRTQAQISYRYERRIAESGNLADQDVHSGLARANVAITHSLTVEGGALATRTRADVRGPAPGLFVGNVANIAQLYSVYGGPTLATRVGRVGIGASYRYGYSKAEAPAIRSTIADQPPLDYFDDSRNQIAQASASVRSGELLPIGMTLSGGWERDDASQLDQRFDARRGRFDAILPVSPTLALVAGVGYEKIEISQRDALTDAVGVPLLDGNGRFRTDPASPRRIAYDFDGIYYDAGVVWRPSPRTAVQARAGERFGSFSFTGSVSYQPNKRMAFNLQVYDGLQTFGRQLRDGLSALPTAFNPTGNALAPDFNGCVFGAAGGAAGGCLNGQLQSLTASAYRARGVDAILSVNSGPLRYGFGAGYANRRLLSPRTAPGVVLNGTDDESAYAQMFIARALDRRTTIDASLIGSWYRSGLRTTRDVYTYGGTGSLLRRIGPIDARASLGIFGTSSAAAGDQVSLEALLGARYSF